MNTLEKPFTEATLLTRIHEALRQAQHAAGLRSALRPAGTPSRSIAAEMLRPGGPAECSGRGGPA
jgi:DNA-binding response OmpR family regulator